MKFNSAPNDPRTGLFNRQVSESGLVEFGIYKVMFGYRVRAGFCNSACCDLDWCGGGNWEDVQRLYAICKTILSKKEENRDCFQGIPGLSAVKPFYNDPIFTEKVLTLSGEVVIEELEQPKKLF